MFPYRAIGFDEARDVSQVNALLCQGCGTCVAACPTSANQMAYPPNVSVIRVICRGRVDPEFVLKAFERGADGVMILACHPGGCTVLMNFFGRHRPMQHLQEGKR